MKTLKKTLCLVLAVVMVVGVLILPASAATYPDDEKIEHKLAVEVLSGLKIMDGTGKGFEPEKPLTRAAGAKIVSWLKQTPADAKDYRSSTGAFTDVAAGYWGMNDIAYCVNNGIIAGKGDGTFAPEDNVTGVEFAKMLMVAIGYDPAANGFVGTTYWRANIENLAAELGLIDDLKPFAFGEPITRDQAAQMAFNALNAKAAFSYYTVYTLKADGETVNKVLYEGKDYDSAMLAAQDKDAKMDEQKSLGEQKYGLAGPTIAWDDWGLNPANVVTSYGKVIASFALPEVANFTTSMDECDVIDEFELKEGGIAYYILNGDLQADAKGATTKGDGALNEQDVGYTMGGQGVETHIYQIGATNTGAPIYLVARIDTWLAQVTKVTAEYKDKNDHKIPRKIDFDIFTGKAGAAAAVETETKTGVQTNNYEEDQYILVRHNAKGWVILSEAAPLTTGALDDWADEEYPDPDTHTLNDTKYSDAEKFFYNWRVDGTRTALNDGFGNIIGLVDANIKANYAIINKIVWNHGGLDGGHAEAELVLADGTVVTGTVAKLNGKAPVNVEVAPTISAGLTNAVTDDVTTNAAFYNHVVTYVANEDGTYQISTLHVHTLASDKSCVDAFDDADKLVNSENTEGPGVITQTQANIYNSKTKAEIVSRGTDLTEYLVQDKNGNWEHYTGKNNVPSVKGNICVVEDEAGYAVLVVVSSVAKADTSTTTFVAYVADPGQNTSNTAKRSINGVEYNVFNVYKLGETKVTKILISNSNVNGFWGTSNNDGPASKGTGLYQFTVGEDNIVGAKTDIVLLADDATYASDHSSDKTDKTDAKLKYTNVGLTENAVGNSMQTNVWTGSLASPTVTNKSSNSQVQNYNLSDAVILVENKAKMDKDSVADLTVGSAKDLGKDSLVLVVYEQRADGRNFAKYVYVIKAVESTGSTVPAAEGKGIKADKTGATADAIKAEADGVYMTVSKTVEGLTLTDNGDKCIFARFTTGAAKTAVKCRITSEDGKTVYYTETDTIEEAGAHIFYVQVVKGDGMHLRDDANVIADSTFESSGLKAGTYKVVITSGSQTLLDETFEVTAAE